MRPHAHSLAWRKNPKIARRNHCHQILLQFNNNNRLDYVVFAIKELVELREQTIIVTLWNNNGA